MKNISYALIALAIFGVGMMFGEYISDLDRVRKLAPVRDTLIVDHVTIRGMGAVSDTMYIYIGYNYTDKTNRYTSYGRVFFEDTKFPSENQIQKEIQAYWPKREMYRLLITGIYKFKNKKEMLEFRAQ